MAHKRALCMLLVSIALAMQIGDSQQQGLVPDLGDKFPKLSLDCIVEFAKYGQPLIKMFMGNTSSSSSASSSKENQIMEILKSPIGQMVDAWGKPPSRIFNLHTNWMGAYDECQLMNFTKYCSTNMKIYNVLDGVYGSCMPKDCTNDDVHKLLNFISKNYLKEFITFPDNGAMTRRLGSKTYCEKPVKYTKGFYVTIVLSAIILVFCLLGSFVDGFVEPRVITKTKHAANGIDNQGADIVDGIPLKELVNEEDVPEEIEKKGSVDENGDANGNVLSEKEVEMNEIETTDKKDDSGDYVKIEKVTIQIDAEPGFLKILRCFSLQRNAKSVMSTDQPKGSVSAIHGIRAISMFWIIIGHLYLWVMSVPNDNAYATIPYLFTEWSFQPVPNAFVAVDTFFLLSGLLVAYLTLKQMDKANGKINLLMYYLHRFLRLTPLYMYVILFWNNVFPYTVFGPLAPRYQTIYHAQACNKYWWTNLLYINNFHPEIFIEGCLDWGWYLANDMQFYIVTPFILYAMYYAEKRYQTSKYQVTIVSSIIVVLCTICVIINAAMVGALDYPTLLVKGNIPGNPRQQNFNENHNKIYTKPYTRINPYLVGILIGYYLSRKVEIKNRFNTLIYFVLWLIAFGLAYAVIYGPYEEAFKELDIYLSDASNVMYGAFNRLVWAIAVGWVVYACNKGYGGYINSLLSWGAWVPISRLSYAAYLIHPCVIFFFYGINERAFHYQDNIIFFQVVSNIFWAYGVAFILAITVEYPCMNLEKLAFSKRKKN